MISRIVITVDGLAGSGKSTLAKHLAARLGYLHLNTGLLYRAVGLMALRSRANPNNEAALAQELPRHTIKLDLSSSGIPAVYLDGQDISSAVQSPEVSQATSQASQFPVVRQALLQMQREAFAGRSVVAEGRDLGTIVFPDAPLKFFIKADEQVRVERRLRQLLDGSTDKSDGARRQLEEKIGIEIRERDKRDTERAVAPTLAANDAVIIDNSKSRLEEVIETMAAEAMKRHLG